MAQSRRLQQQTLLNYLRLPQTSLAIINPA